VSLAGEPGSRRGRMTGPPRDPCPDESKPPPTTVRPRSSAPPPESIQGRKCAKGRVAGEHCPRGDERPQSPDRAGVVAGQRVQRTRRHCTLSRGRKRAKGRVAGEHCPRGDERPQSPDQAGVVEQRVQPSRRGRKILRLCRPPVEHQRREANRDQRSGSEKTFTSVPLQSTAGGARGARLCALQRLQKGKGRGAG